MRRIGLEVTLVDGSIIDCKNFMFDTVEMENLSEEIVYDYVRIWIHDCPILIELNDIVSIEVIRRMEEDSNEA